MRKITLLWVLLLCMQYVSFGQDDGFCEDFNDQNISNWFGVAAGASTVDSPGPTGDPTDYFLHSYDASGSSYIYNDVDYGGDWRNYEGQCLCWDFQVLNDGNLGTPLSPRLIIYSGSPTAPTATATFIATVSIAEGEGWVHVCAPIETCTGPDLPQNANGQWVMGAGLDCNDWNTLLSNISGIRFYLDLTSYPIEEYGYDNICIQDCDIQGEPNDEGSYCCGDENLVENGNFEAGNVGFTSEYTEDSAVYPGQYNVASDAMPFDADITDHSFCDDPDTYASNDQFLLVNGRTTQPAGTSSVVWEQDVPVQPEKNYKMCANFKNMPQCTFDIKPEIRFEINGILSDWQVVDTNSDDPCDWLQISECFTGEGDIINIKIHLKEDGNGDGNDLAIDDISVQEKLDQGLSLTVQHQGEPQQITGSVNTIDPADDAILIEEDCLEQYEGNQYYWFIYELAAYPFTGPIDFINMVPDTFSWSSNLGGFSDQIPASANPPWALTTNFPNYNFEDNKLYVIGMYVPSCCESCYDEAWSYQLTFNSGRAVSADMDVFTTEVKDHIKSLFKEYRSTVFEDDTLENTLSVFPNPSVSTLRFNTEEKVVSYEILDISGKALERQNTQKQEVDISRLAPNMYFLSVVTESGAKHTVKFIKK